MKLTSFNWVRPRPKARLLGSATPPTHRTTAPDGPIDWLPLELSPKSTIKATARQLTCSSRLLSLLLSTWKPKPSYYRQVNHLIYWYLFLLSFDRVTTYATIFSLYQNFSNVNYSFCCWPLSPTCHQPARWLISCQKVRNLRTYWQIVVIELSERQRPNLMIQSQKKNAPKITPLVPVK